MKPSICFVSPNAYNVLSKQENSEHIGGAEVQQVIIAHALATRGYRVSFVTLDHGQPDRLQFGDITVRKAYKPDAGIPVLRFFHPRISGLWSAMARADADIYYQRGAGMETGIVARWCKRNDRKFVFSIAHDSNCDSKLPLLKSSRERWLYRYGLKRADAVVAQTERQERALNAEFGLNSVLIRSCVRSTSCSSSEAKERGSTNQRRLLWVGRFTTRKRPDVLLSLAHSVPNVVFDVVGTGDPSAEFTLTFNRQAREHKCIYLHGYVPHREMPRFYDDATALLCTSMQEGFPNTFLEAWTHGIPVITTVDPDNLVERHCLGVVCENVEELPRVLEEFIAAPDKVKDCGLRAAKYVREHHAVERAVDAYEELFVRIAGC